MSNDTAGRHHGHGAGQHQEMMAGEMGEHPHGQMQHHEMMNGMHGDMTMHCQMHDCEAEAAAVEATLRAYSDAIHAEDMVAMEALVVADERFSVIEGRGTDVGWANYRDHHLGPEFASERIEFHSYGYDNIEVRIGHIFSYATFTYAFQATLDDEPYNKEGRGTAVLMRTPEGWRIRHIQTS